MYRRFIAVIFFMIGILGDTLSSFTSLLPKPQDIGQGLGDGISSFIQTLPQIGQSFQSLLPSFENFQLPSLPSLPPFVQGTLESPQTPLIQSFLTISKIYIFLNLPIYDPVKSIFILIVSNISIT